MSLHWSRGRLVYHCTRDACSLWGSGAASLLVLLVCIVNLSKNRSRQLAVVAVFPKASAKVYTFCHIRKTSDRFFLENGWFYRVCWFKSVMNWGDTLLYIIRDSRYSRYSRNGFHRDKGGREERKDAEEMGHGWQGERSHLTGWKVTVFLVKGHLRNWKGHL